MKPLEVVFWQGGDNDGCTFYRCQEPARVLSKCATFPEYWNRPINARSTRMLTPEYFETADVIVGQRISEDGPTELWKRLAEGHYGVRPKLVFEWDDDLLSIPKHLGALHEHYAEPRRRENIVSSIRRADAVLTTNPHLAERTNDVALGDVPVHIAENWVSGDHLTDEPTTGYGRTVVGWAGSGTHAEDFKLMAEGLYEVLYQERAHVQLVGADYRPLITRSSEMFGPRLTHRPWVRDVAEHIRRLDFHIGVAPLANDTFNRSKSDIKIKEYAARGIAPVCSDVGPYADSKVPRLLAETTMILGNGKNLVTPWDSILPWIVDEAAARHKLATRALDWARQNTLEHHIDQWLPALATT